ncbi:MAG: hypothetical protein ABSC36_05000 [Gaiellaceae bacterium]|jgi:hypothetical protein
MTLETVDLTGVEILSTGGPIHGKGSPPEGDFFTAADLRKMAEAARELAGEITPPAKIGHSREQRLAGVTDGELPATGWLSNIRTSQDGARLLADVKRVPKKLGELIRAGAYRARSVELSKVTSQKTGKSYEWVVTGLAWLGARLPAVRTLDDVVTLYEGEGAIEVRAAVEYSAPDQSMSRCEPLVDIAIFEGRIGHGDRDNWQRAFEEDSDAAATAILSCHRNASLARFNGLSAEDRELAERRYIATAFKIDLEEVI